MEVSFFGQIFFPAEARAMAGEPNCSDNDGGCDCDYCDIYYNGPESSAFDESKVTPMYLKIVKAATHV